MATLSDATWLRNLIAASLVLLHNHLLKVGLQDKFQQDAILSNCINFDIVFLVVILNLKKSLNVFRNTLQKFK